MTLLSRILTHDEKEENHVKLEQDKAKLNLLSHQIQLNEKTLNVLKKISELNSELIKVNL